MVVITMNLFQTIKTFYQMIGIHSISNTQSKQINWLNVRNVFFIFAPFVLITSAMTYFVNAESVIEQVETFFASLTGLACIVNYVVQFLHIDNILQLIKNFNEFTQKSK